MVECSCCLLSDLSECSNSGQENRQHGEDETQVDVWHGSFRQGSGKRLLERTTESSPSANLFPTGRYGLSQRNPTDSCRWLTCSARIGPTYSFGHRTLGALGGGTYSCGSAGAVSTFFARCRRFFGPRRARAARFIRRSRRCGAIPAGIGGDEKWLTTESTNRVESVAATGSINGPAVNKYRDSNDSTRSDRRLVPRRREGVWS